MHGGRQSKAINLTRVKGNSEEILANKHDFELTLENETRTSIWYAHSRKRVKVNINTRHNTPTRHVEKKAREY